MPGVFPQAVLNERGVSVVPVILHLDICHGLENRSPDGDGKANEAERGELGVLVHNEDGRKDACEDYQGGEQMDSRQIHKEVQALCVIVEFGVSPVLVLKTVECAGPVGCKPYSPECHHDYNQDFRQTWLRCALEGAEDHYGLDAPVWIVDR